MPRPRLIDSRIDKEEDRNKSVSEKMAGVEISVVGENLRAKLGEGPHWDTKTQRLFWVDYFDSSIHVLDVETGKVNSCVM